VSKLAASAGGGRSVRAKISGGRGRPWGIFFLGFYKTFCYPTVQMHCATCLRFDTIPACDRRTDGQTDGRTDGIAIASRTALAMRALRRAVKFTRVVYYSSSTRVLAAARGSVLK